MNWPGVRRRAARLLDSRSDNRGAERMFSRPGFVVPTNGRDLQLRLWVRRTSVPQYLLRRFLGYGSLLGPRHSLRPRLFLRVRLESLRGRIRVNSTIASPPPSSPRKSRQSSQSQTTACGFRPPSPALPTLDPG